MPRAHLKRAPYTRCFEAMLTVTTLPRPDHDYCQDRHDWHDIQHSICRSNPGLTSCFRAQDATFSSGLVVEEQRKQHSLQQNLWLRMNYLSHQAFLMAHTCAVMFHYLQSICFYAQSMHCMICTKTACLQTSSVLNTCVCCCMCCMHGVTVTKAALPASQRLAEHTWRGPMLIPSTTEPQRC